MLSGAVSSAERLLRWLPLSLDARKSESIRPRPSAIINPNTRNGHNMNTVDVVIPCYNYGRYLRGCVESVLSQSGVRVRALVIDDASSDDTPQVGMELAALDSRVQFCRHNVNKGHIATYNEGIEWVSADYMLLLSADDYLLPNALSRAASLMSSHPEVGLTVGKAIETKDGNPPRPSTGGNIEGHRILTGSEFIRYAGACNVVPTPTAIIRSKLQKKVGGYRPELPHAGDMEMWLRLAAHASVAILNSFQAVYRRHDTNMSGVYYRNGGSLPDLLQRKAALDLFLETCGTLLANPDLVRRRLYWSLSRDAIGRASSALNYGESITAERLCAFALHISPSAARSLPWLKFVCKRRLPHVWHFVQPAVMTLRQLESILRRHLRVHNHITHDLISQ